MILVDFFIVRPNIVKKSQALSYFICIYNMTNISLRISNINNKTIK